MTMKVLVGIDGSDRSFHALEYASRILSCDWDCVVFFSPPEFQCNAKREISETLSELARETVAEAVFSRAIRLLPEGLQRTASTVLGPMGNPAQGILDAAQQIEANLYHVVSMMADEEVKRIRRYIPTGDLCSRKLLEDYRVQSEEQASMHRARLAEGRDQLPKIVKLAETEVACGSPVENIVKKVTEENVDLVVVSARKLGLIGRLTGSTTEGLLNHCPCSLLVLHQKDLPTRDSAAVKKQCYAG
jgi:nucleotide-binding universal stress UspA family protein